MRYRHNYLLMYVRTRYEPYRPHQTTVKPRTAKYPASGRSSRRAPLSDTVPPRHNVTQPCGCQYGYAYADADVNAYALTRSDTVHVTWLIITTGTGHSGFGRVSTSTVSNRLGQVWMTLTAHCPGPGGTRDIERVFIMR